MIICRYSLQIIIIICKIGFLLTFENNLKYRCRIIIERNIGSVNYQEIIIVVEVDSLDKGIEFDI